MRRILLPRIVREHSCVTRMEVKRSGVAITNEDGSLSLALMEIEPFLGLE
jgi:hypothetical protein